MTTTIPDEIQIAKLSIEAATTALDALFRRMQVLPRAEKMIVSETVHEACLRLDAAKALLARLEAAPPAGDDA